MRVIVGCEYSGTVRDSFLTRGHDAISVDILPTDSKGPHHIGDLLEFCKENAEKYDMLIAHPPCTHLAVSGARWFKDKQLEQREALNFVKQILELPFKYIALENPVSIISTHIRKPDQIIQPWMFGESYTKTTCLWLKNLPKLVPTNVVDKGEFVIHGGKKLPKWYSNRTIARDKTFKGIAEAMADQWGNL